MEHMEVFFSFFWALCFDFFMEPSSNPTSGQSHLTTEHVRPAWGHLFSSYPAFDSDKGDSGPTRY